MTNTHDAVPSRAAGRADLGETDEDSVVVRHDLELGAAARQPELVDRRLDVVAVRQRRVHDTGHVEGLLKAGEVRRCRDVRLQAQSASAVGAVSTSVHVSGTMTVIAPVSSTSCTYPSGIVGGAAASARARREQRDDEHRE